MLWLGKLCLVLRPPLPLIILGELFPLLFDLKINEPLLEFFMEIFYKSCVVHQSFENKLIVSLSKELESVRNQLNVLINILSLVSAGSGS